MMVVLRNIGAVLVGLFLGGCVNMGMILISAFVLWPLPAGVHFDDPEGMRAYIASVPVVALLWAIAAHLGQAFVGGGVAAKLGTAPVPLALVVGVLSMVGGVVSILDLQGPTWMWVEIPLYLVVSYAAAQLVLRAERR